jgi:hypothetical protein
MSNTKHISEIVQNPQSDIEKAIAELSCMQILLKSPPKVENGEAPLEEWLDNQEVMHALHISPRTLQTLRSNGTLPFSRIGKKLYYRYQDIIKILSDNYTLLFVFMVADFKHCVIVGQDFNNVLIAIIEFFTYARKWQCAV